MPKLIVHSTPTSTTEIDLNGQSRVAIGRDPASDVVLQWRMASRQHAIVEQRGTSYWIKDNDSFNGTSLNDQPVQESELHSGDEIRVAGALIVFVDPAQAGYETEFADVPTEPDLPIAQLGLAPDTPSDPEADTLVVPPTVPVPEQMPTVVPGPSSQAAPAVPPSPTPSTHVPKPAPSSPATAAVPATTGGHASPLRWLLPLVLLAGLAGASLLRTRSNTPREPAPAAATPDRQALESALAAPLEDRIGRLWGFVADHPDSDESGRAYRALIDAGATRDLVCRHAQQNSPAALGTDLDLAAMCEQP